LETIYHQDPYRLGEITAKLLILIRAKVVEILTLNSMRKTMVMTEED
jgi:hypothetical protein